VLARGRRLHVGDHPMAAKTDETTKTSGKGWIAALALVTLVAVGTGGAARRCAA
jgi:hypothetical protein